MMQVRASTVLVDKDKGSLLPRVLNDFLLSWEIKVGVSAALRDEGRGLCC